MAEFKDNYYNEHYPEATTLQSKAEGRASSALDEYSDEEKENSDPNTQSIYSELEKSVGSRYTLQQSSESHSEDHRLGKRVQKKSLNSSFRINRHKAPLAELREETVPDHNEDDLYFGLNCKEQRTSSLLAKCFGDYESVTVKEVPYDPHQPCIAYVFNENIYRIGVDRLNMIHKTQDLIFVSPTRNDDSPLHQLPSLMSDHNSFNSYAYDPFRMKEDNAVLSINLGISAERRRHSYEQRDGVDQHTA